MHRLILLQLRLQCRTRSRMPVITQTPATSAAIAVPDKGTAILLIVIHLSLSTPVNHDTRATFTVVLGAAIPEAFHRLPSFRVGAFVYNTFLCPSAPTLAM